MPNAHEIAGRLSDPECQALLGLGGESGEDEPIPTEIIDSLEARGLIDFRPSENSAGLTDLGRRVYESLTASK